MKEKPSNQSILPPGWNKTTDDLLKELHERGSIPHQEMEWAEEYELGLIPAEYRFAQKGDVYESLKDQSVEVIFWYNAPGSGCDDAMLYKGERIWIYNGDDEPSLVAYAHPLDYKGLESRMVPEEVLNASFYSGYSIYIKTTTLNETFRLGETGYEPETK